MWSPALLQLSVSQITNKWCVIRLVTPTTSTIKYNQGFHVYRTHLLDHYPFLDTIICLLVLWRASLTTSIFYYFFSLKYSTPSIRGLCPCLEQPIWGLKTHLFKWNIFCRHAVMFLWMNNSKLLPLFFHWLFFTNNMVKLGDNISSQNISKQQNV